MSSKANRKSRKRKCKACKHVSRGTADAQKKICPNCGNDMRMDTTPSLVFDYRNREG